MASSIIPTGTNPIYSQRSTLGGKDYQLHFQYNQRMGRWFLDVHDQDDVPIVQGIRLVTGFPLARGVTDPNRPLGVIIVEDRQGTGLEDVDVEAQASRDAGLLELGERFALVFIDEEA